jgi:thymidylate synthase
MIIQGPTIADVYPRLLKAILQEGDTVEIGRVKLLTKELMNVQLIVDDCRWNLFEQPTRKLNYRFQIAEWLWVVSGRNDVGTLSFYNSRIARYSDDGKIFAGAYGPRLAPQWPYIIDTLKADPSSRQAVATIWTPNPPKSRDQCCTISCQFLVRRDKLHGVFNMRSSDAWLGVPPDVYTFAMITNGIAGSLGLVPGSLTMNLGSSHLYEWDLEGMSMVNPRRGINVWEAANLASQHSAIGFKSPLLTGIHGPYEAVLMNDLRGLANDYNKPVWHYYAAALHSKTSHECLEILRKGVD